MRTPLVRWTAALALSAFAVGVSAQNFARNITPIRVGTLLVQGQVSNGELFNPAPHVWFSLDREFGVKPGNWQLSNPLAQAQLSSSVRDRWLALGGNPPAVASRITKADAAYWEVRLNDLQEQQVNRFDVLLLPVAATIALNPRERELLRNFVDQGGTLWVDVIPGGRVEEVNSLPIPFRTSNLGGQVFADLAHPLMTNPVQITPEELNSLYSLTAVPNVITALPNGAFPGDRHGWIVPDSRKLEAVAGPDLANKTIAVAQWGNGYMVVTSRGLTEVLNRGLTASGGISSNLGYAALRPVRDFPGTVASKLGFNILSLNSGYFGPGRSSRKSNSVPVEVTAPLLRRFETTQFIPAQGTNVAHYKGLIIMNSGGALVALDAEPSRDLDQDGSEDDGIVDEPGSPVDVVWRANVDAASSPVVALVPNAPDGARDQVVVRTSDGGVVAIALGIGNTADELYRIAAPGGSSNGPRFSPTVHEGIGYVTDQDSTNRGRIWQFDLGAGELLQGSRPYALERAPRLQRPSGSPTVGYIRVFDNSGAMDKVAYVPTQLDTTTRLPAGIVSTWVGTRGESPVSLEDGGGILVVNTRASQQGVPIANRPGTSQGVKLSIINQANGRPIPESQFGSIVTGAIAVNSGVNGRISIPVASTDDFIDQGGVPARYGIRVDYTLDWGAPTLPGNGSAQSDQFVRGEIAFPDRSTPRREIVGGITLSNTGMLFVGVSNPSNTADNAGAGFFALREEGRGDFKLYYRYEFFDGAQFDVNAAGQAAQRFDYGPALIDYDGLLEFPGVGGILDRKMENWRIVGSPVLRGDTVYVTATADKSIFGNAAKMTTLVALDAQPDVAEFRLDALEPNFILVQPDPARSEGAVPILTTLQQGSYVYDQDENVDPVSGKKNGRLRLLNAMQTTRGRIGAALIANLPVIVRVPNRGDILVEPEQGTTGGRAVAGRAGGRWSPLRWYTVFNGLTVTNPPVLTGRVLYMGGTSILPGLVNAGRFDQPRGLLNALNIEVASSDLTFPNAQRPWMTSAGIPARPWQPSLSQVSGNPPNIRGTDYLLFPQFFGVATFDDFRVRLNQATLDDTTLLNAAAGDGTVTAWGQNEFYAFNRADFLLADDGRISRIDSSGNPIWSIDSTKSSGPEVPLSGLNKPVTLATPWRIYPVGTSSYIITDPGADRIVRVDLGGREIRSIDGLKLDPRFIPDGWNNNSSKRLRLPRDVVTYTSIVPQGQNPFTNVSGDEYWRHYLIADQGNFRVIELVDRYRYQNRRVGNIVDYVDPQSDAPGQREQAYGVLLWHTRSEFTGKQFAYNSIGRIQVKDASNAVRTVYAFGFGNIEPTRASIGLDAPAGTATTESRSGYGGVLIYDPARGAQNLLTDFRIPAIPAGKLFDPASNGFATSPAVAARTAKFAGLTSVTLRYIGLNQYAVMVTDNSGVYELVETNPGVWECVWMLPNNVYRAMRRRLSDDQLSQDAPLGFRAFYARRLDSGDVLITNGYVGRKRSGASFAGEVVLLNGQFDAGGADTDPGFDFNKKNLGFNSLSVRFELPPIAGFRQISVPVFADRR